VEELPGANTQGANLEEARENLKEAVAMVLQANRELAEESLRGAEVVREPLAHDRMKWRDLLRHLEKHGCELLREGSNHTIYVNRRAQKSSAIPRHREIIEFIARKSAKI
jgi:mRNA interferase HicA